MCLRLTVNNQLELSNLFDPIPKWDHVKMFF